MWGVIAVGIFSGNPQPIDTTAGKTGLLHGKKKTQNHHLCFLFDKCLIHCYYYFRRWMVFSRYSDASCIMFNDMGNAKHFCNTLGYQ